MCSLLHWRGIIIPLYMKTIWDCSLTSAEMCNMINNLHIYIYWLSPTNIKNCGTLLCHKLDWVFLFFSSKFPCKTTQLPTRFKISKGSIIFSRVYNKSALLRFTSLMNLLLQFLPVMYWNAVSPARNIPNEKLKSLQKYPDPQGMA